MNETFDGVYPNVKEHGLDVQAGKLLPAPKDAPLCNATELTLEPVHAIVICKLVHQ